LRNPLTNNRYDVLKIPSWFCYCIQKVDKIEYLNLSTLKIDIWIILSKIIIYIVRHNPAERTNLEVQTFSQNKISRLVFLWARNVLKNVMSILKLHYMIRRHHWAIEAKFESHLHVKLKFRLQLISMFNLEKIIQPKFQGIHKTIWEK